VESTFLWKQVGCTRTHAEWSLYFRSDTPVVPGNCVSKSADAEGNTLTVTCFTSRKSELYFEAEKSNLQAHSLFFKIHFNCIHSFLSLPSTFPLRRVQDVELWISEVRNARFHCQQFQENQYGMNQIWWMYRMSQDTRVSLHRHRQNTIRVRVHQEKTWGRCEGWSCRLPQYFEQSEDPFFYL